MHKRTPANKSPTRIDQTILGLEAGAAASSITGRLDSALELNELLKITPHVVNRFRLLEKTREFL